MFISVFFDFINTFAKAYKIKLAIIVFLSVIAAGFEFVGLSLIYSFALLASGQKITLNILPNIQSGSKTVLFLGILIALTYILKDLFMIGFINFQNNILANLTGSIFRKIYGAFLSDDFFAGQKISYSDKIKMLEDTTNGTVWNFLGKILVLATNLIVASFIIFYLFYKFKTDALILSVFILLIWSFENFYFKKKAKKYSPLILESSREKNNFIVSTLNCAKEAIIYNKREYFKNTASYLHNRCASFFKKTITNESMPTYFTEIGLMAAFALFITLVVFKNSDTTILMASLAAAAAVILRIVPTINRTQSALHGINCYKDEARWFVDTFKSLPKANKEDAAILPFKNNIKLENVCFSYNKETAILKNISFEIKKGEFIGILGPSGSGKTTLFNILSALYTADSGVMSVDNIALNNADKNQWRNNISILTQDYSLPFDKIEQNITLELNAKTNTKIIESLKMANIFNELDKDKISDTNKLSSGQKHRIALARALYFDREVIMLDEATSSLDIENEDIIVKSLYALKGKKTVITIAHRLNTLKECDRLIYMQDGQITDIGTFDELKQKHDSFKKLVEMSTF